MASEPGLRACGTERAGPGPQSWSDDVNSYRTARGCQSFSTIQAAGVPERFSRTNYVPFLDTRHPLFAYNDFQDGKGSVRVDPATTAARAERHGWGDTSLLREDGHGGAPHPSAGPPHTRGRARPASPPGTDGRHGMFGVLQMTEVGAPDGWVGHPLVHPSKGRRSVPAPTDSRGRRNLFDVLHARTAGAPADDAWLGHPLIDPARGKAHPPGPEQTRGRRDLTGIVAQSIMQDPRRLELLQKGADKFGDAWCGHALIDPARGKQTAYADAAAAAAHLTGATFRPGPPPPGSAPAAPHSDLPRRHNHFVQQPQPDNVPTLLRAEGGGGDDRGRLGRRAYPELPAPNRFDGRRDMYGHMTYRPLSEAEATKYGKAFDDSGRQGGRRVLPTPGSADPAKGADLLQWRPEVRLGQFVPRGGLAQEGRARGATLRAISGR